MLTVAKECLTNHVCVCAAAQDPGDGVSGPAPESLLQQLVQLPADLAGTFRVLNVRLVFPAAICCATFRSTSGRCWMLRMCGRAIPEAPHLNLNPNVRIPLPHLSSYQAEDWLR